MSERILVVEPNFSLKMRVLHSIDRPLSRMKVDDICRRSGISRRTFYYHFATKYDIAQWYGDLCQRLYLDEIGRSLTWTEGLTKHFETLVSEREFYQYVTTNYDPRTHARELVAMHRRETILQTLREFHGIMDPSPLLRFCIDSYLLCETTFAQKWFSRGMDTAPDVLAQMMEAVVPNELKRLLNETPCPRAMEFPFAEDEDI